MLLKLLSDASWAEPIVSGSVLRLPLLNKVVWSLAQAPAEARAETRENRLLQMRTAENMAEQFRYKQNG